MLIPVLTGGGGLWLPRERYVPAREGWPLPPEIAETYTRRVTGHVAENYLCAGENPDV